MINDYALCPHLYLKEKTVDSITTFILSCYIYIPRGYTYKKLKDFGVNEGGSTRRILILIERLNGTGTTQEIKQIELILTNESTQDKIEVSSYNWVQGSEPGHVANIEPAKVYNTTIIDFGDADKDLF